MTFKLIRRNNCIVAERGATLCRITVHPGLRYGAQRPTTRRRSAATRRRSVATRTASVRHGVRQGPVLRYNVCIVTGGNGREAATRLCVAIQPATRSATSHDTVGHKPTTLSRHGRPGRSVRGLCAQAGPRVGALCTRLSFDSVHCLSHCLGHCS